MNREQLRIRILGVLNIVFGVIFLIIFAPDFFIGVILGWVTDERFRDAYNKFMSIVILRLMIDIRYIFFFILAFSGVAMIRFKRYSRKLAVFSATILIVIQFLGLILAMINSMRYGEQVGFNLYYIIPLLIFLLYAIFLLTYLNKPKVKAIFNDKDVKLSFKIPIIIIIIAFFSPTIINGVFKLLDFF